MCGIVGYIGKKQVVPVIVDGLRRLEYRGYDSAGIAVAGGEHGLQIRRAEGKLRNLEEVIRHNSIDGTYGIGHTRWATHGRPSEENAHPAPRLQRNHRGRAQRDRGKLSGAEETAARGGPHLQDGDRYRSHRAPDRKVFHPGKSGQEDFVGRSRAHDCEAVDRRLCHGGDLQHGTQQDYRGAQRAAGGDRAGQG